MSILLCNCVTTYAGQNIKLLYRCLDSMVLNETTEVVLIIHVDNYDAEKFKNESKLEYVGHFIKSRSLVDQIRLKYNIDQLVILVSRTRLNVSGSRNKMIDYCRRHYNNSFIRFVDDDDISIPLNFIVKIIHEELAKDNNIKVIKGLMAISSTKKGSQYDTVYNKSKPLFKYRFQHQSKKFVHSLPMFIFKDAHTTIFHTSLHMIQFPDFIPNEDLIWNYFLFLYCLENNIRVSIVDELMYYITGHSNSWVDNNRFKINTSHFNQYEKYIKNIDWILISIKCRQRLLEHFALFHENCVDYLYRKDQYDQSKIEYMVDYKDFIRKIGNCKNAWIPSSKILNYDVTTSLLYIMSEHDCDDNKRYTMFYPKAHLDKYRFILPYLSSNESRLKLLNKVFNDFSIEYNQQDIDVVLNRLMNKSDDVVSYELIKEIINKNNEK